MRDLAGIREILLQQREILDLQGDIGRSPPTPIPTHESP